ncbi:hypothetical protein FKR81_02890 [Lentzea tibetensis]|uniref:Uncharacterized protein n=1 Tax=Lentzea tibetensis TaxID=2591470 RepID=A0A563F1C5_9PSEU|nr:DUF6223 family protein [Lentzea tibetensis]TWP53719.1 hypothetical protein FKR81_02890 [Lentzea tibetensis]
MSVRRLLTAVALVGLLVLATPAAAQALVQPAGVGAYTLTAGRLWSLVAALLGLAGVVVGVLALARPASWRRRAVVALVAGLAGAVIGGLVVAAAEGGPGTGYGIVGGFVALVVGLISMGLGGLALVRSRRSGRAVTG